MPSTSIFLKSLLPRWRNISFRRSMSERVRDMIVDDIRRAQLNGVSKEKVLMLLHVLHHFLKSHPDATPSDHPWSKRF